METSRGRRWLRFGFGVLVAAGLIAGAWGIMSAGRHAQPPATSEVTATKSAVVVPVTVEPIRRRPVERVVTVVGSLWGREEITISPKVEGRIIKIHHDVGDRVAPGTKLLEIDPTDYQLAVEEAKRSLDLELSRLGLQSIPAGKFEVAQLPTVLRAASQERNAMNRRDRVRKLGSSVAATQEDVDQAETDYVVARANYRQAVLEAESTLAAARYRLAILETAQQRWKDTVVIAPPSREAVEYVVADRKVTEGEIVRIMPGDDSALFKLMLDDPLKLKVTVPERHKAEVRVGQPVRVYVEAYRDETFNGVVARVNPAVDRASRTFQVEIQIPNPQRRLSPGSFAKATIITEANAQALIVPEESIVRFAGVTKLFIVRGGVAKQVPVTSGVVLADERVGAYPRKWVEVIGSDLKVGDSVVVTGQSKLVEGSAVRVRTTTEDAP